MPTVYTQHPEVFSALLSRGFTDPIRLVVLGDSQETSPGGAGAAYIPRLNYEFFRLYGNSPETPFNAGAFNSGGGQPPADWLLRCTVSAPGPGPTRLAPEMIPPNLIPATVSLLNSDNVNQNERFGVLLTLEPGAENTNPDTQLSGFGPFFNTSQGVYVDVFAATNPSSGELSLRTAPTNSHVPTYFAQTRETAVSSMQLSDTSSLFRSQRLGPFAIDPGEYFQVEIGGTDAALVSDFAAAVIVSAADQHGATVSSLSQGGYRVANYLDGHAQGTPLIEQYHPDAILIHYGANDAAAGYSTARFFSDMTDLLTHLREHFGASFPIFVFSEAYSNINPDYADTRDRYAGVLYQMAQSDPYLCLVNSRRLSDEGGWNASTATNYLADGVHYNGAGARALARVEINAIEQAFLGSCPGPELQGLPDQLQICEHSYLFLPMGVPVDFGLAFQWQIAVPGGQFEDLQDGSLPWDPDASVQGSHSRFIVLGNVPLSLDQAALRCVVSNGCGQSVSTSSTLLVRDTSFPGCQPRDCDADINQDGVSDQTDVDYLINAIAGGGNPSDSNLDFNQDGVADQADVDALVNVIAGGACP